MTFCVLVFIAEMLEVKGTLYFFDTFMEKRDGGYRNRYNTIFCQLLDIDFLFIAECFIWQQSQGHGSEC